MSPDAVTIGPATLSRSQPRFALRCATPSVIASTKTDDRTAPITEITTKSAIEIVFCRLKPTAIALARTASTSEIDSDSASEATRFWPTRVSVRREQAIGAGVDRGAEPAAEGAEDVAAHADRGGHEDEQSGQLLERAR